MDEKADPMLGRVLDGRYRIDRRIARGGMAMVYEAMDLRLDRVVAVKIMHEPLADDPTFVVRFEREARSAAKLSHPNAVSVLDQGEDAGTLFLVMEYVPGVTLRDLIRREAPLPPSLALRVLESVLAALTAAHRIGIVHRDIKPENVLLATADVDKMDPRHTKVADFGLARAINAETQHTATGGVIIGTVSYLAPEMLVNAAADARVDVYAAGVLLYELLTGKKPHQADNPIQVAYKHVHEDIGKPSDEVRGIPPYLDALVARATARDADQRPADASVLRHHVQRVRQALDAGVIDDPELTADLLPSARSPHEDTAASGIAGWEGGAFVEPHADYEATAQLDRVVPGVIDAPPSGLRPMPPMREAQKRRRRRALVSLLVLLLLILGIAFGSWYFFVERYTHTPNVVGLAEPAAITALHKAGLNAREGQSVYSGTVSKGDVVSTDPGPNSRVLKSSTVVLVISLGKPEVPRLAGLTQAAATTKLSAVHLKVGTITKAYSDTVKTGIVISSSPPAGTALAPNEAVALTVSKGFAPVQIPDFTHKRLSDARRAFAKLGLKVQVASSAFSDSVPSGSIISQSPKNTTGHRGDTVTVVVSKGPQMGTIPQGLVGMSLKQAEKALKQAGFTNIGHSYPLGTPIFNRVYGVTPSSGSSWPLHKQVVLTVV
ncbi:MAG: Stk1 family PASTA domain-containing Ser/Thr kinase [Marmoricola sp.]